MGSLVFLPPAAKRPGEENEGDLSRPLAGLVGPMATESTQECIIWHPDGCWFQKRDRDGNLRSSWMGRRRLEQLERFCIAHGIELSIHGVLQHRHGNGGFTCPSCPKVRLAA